MICKDCRWAADMPGEGGMHMFCIAIRYDSPSWCCCQHKVIDS